MMIRREFLEKASLCAAGVIVGFTPRVQEPRTSRHAELWAFVMPRDPVYKGSLFADEKRDILGIHTNGSSSLVMPLSQMKKQMHYKAEAQKIIPGWMRFDKKTSLDVAIVQKRSTFVTHEHHSHDDEIPVWMMIEDLEEILERI